MSWDESLVDFLDPELAKQYSRSMASRNKRYYIGEPYSGAYLTTREAQVIVHFLMGRTVGSTAIELSLSPRTVEYYARNIKLKLQCRKKTELLDRLVKSNFMENLIQVLSTDENNSEE